MLTFEKNYGSFTQRVDEKGRWLVNFSAALAAMKRGEKVARAHWGGYWFIPKAPCVVLPDDGFPNNMAQMIVAKLKTDCYAPAAPYQEDLLADDWIVIGREEEEDQTLFSNGITAGTIKAGQITGATISADQIKWSTPDDTATVENVLKKRIEELRKMVELQGKDGNWNYDLYNHGMYNGLAIALSTMENCEPAFKDAPSEWLREKNVQSAPNGDQQTPSPTEDVWGLMELLRTLSTDTEQHVRDLVLLKLTKLLKI